MTTRQIITYIHKNRDWAAVIGVALIVVVAVFVAIGIMAGDPAPSDERRNMTKTYPVTYDVVPPDPKYPSPSKTQLPFDTTQNIGDVSIELFWANRNVGRDSRVGSHSFTLTITNTRNKHVTVDGELLTRITVGCVARDNPYRHEQVKPMQAFTMTPYEKKVISFGMDVQCMYLGTADRSYFWRIY